MICPFCGSDAGTNKYCPNCGGQLPIADAAQAQPGAAPTQAPMQAPTAQPYQQPQQPYQPPATPAAPVAGMPSTGAAIALIVVGFLCGILWGIIGITQYGPMKRAIEAGDVETAKKKFNVIMIATIIGVVLNVLIVVSGAMG